MAIFFENQVTPTRQGQPQVTQVAGNKTNGLSLFF
jgi:hypothetical protein